jgi:hypothetical protein
MEKTGILVNKKLELHYFFNDGSHTIDSLVRHKCETELLNLITEVANQLQVKVNVETEVSAEGGFIDLYIITSLDVSLAALGVSVGSLIIGIINTVLSRYPVNAASKEQIEINYEISKLTLQKLVRENQENDLKSVNHNATLEKLNKKIQDLEQKFQEITKPKPYRIPSITKQIEAPPITNTQIGILPDDSIDRLIDKLNFNLDIIPNENDFNEQVIKLGTALSIMDDSPKVKKHKSNLFASLKKYPKITSISSREVNNNKEPIGETLTISRENFSNYIIDSNELPVEKDYNASIEIISPVLKSVKRVQWKGIYKGAIIDFYMGDGKFKESVINQKVSFTSGISIECTLEIRKKIDDFGNINVSSYSAINVVGYTEGDVKIETEKGKKIRKKQQPYGNQEPLFSDDELY